MKNVFILIFSVLVLLGSSFSVYAKEISSGKIDFNYFIPYKIVEVTAKCAPPRFEDDIWHVYYDTESYKEIVAANKVGLSDILLKKDCSDKNLSNSLSKEDFETVMVLLISINELNSSWKKIYKDFIKNL